MSAPTLVARKRSAPLRLIVPAITSSPGPFSTGTLSPVTSALVDAGPPVDDLAVDRHLVAGPQHHQVADLTTSLDGHLDVVVRRVMTVACCGTRSSSARSASVVPRRLRHLHPVAEEHEGDQHRGGLEEGLPCGAKMVSAER